MKCLHSIDGVSYSLVVFLERVNVDTVANQTNKSNYDFNSRPTFNITFNFTSQDMFHR